MNPRPARPVLAVVNWNTPAILRKRLAAGIRPAWGGRDLARWRYSLDAAVAADHDLYLELAAAVA
jgi:hypothetical protein